MNIICGLTKLLKPPPKCIYCGKTDQKLTKEHVIPRGLGGTCTIPSASCEDCQKITSKLEHSILRGTYLPLRTKAKFPTGHKNNRPNSFEATAMKTNGSSQKIEIPTSKYPTLYIVVHLPPPGILSNAELNEKNPEMRISFSGNQEEVNALFSEYPDTEAFEFSSEVVWGDLCRMLAKIAHGFTVMHLGTESYTSLLPPVILGNSPYLSHLVGGAVPLDESCINESIDGYGFELSINDTGYIIVNIDIIGGRLPTYTVVAGLVSDWNAFWTNFSHRSKEGKKEYAHGMRTRGMFIHEWVIWVIQIIRHFVERDFANLMTRWPLLAGYSFDAYALPPTHYLIVLKNTLEEIPSGPDVAVALPYNDHPNLPPSIIDIGAWQQWCRNRLSLSHSQWPILLPVHDLGKAFNVDAEFKQFSEDEKKFWLAQLQFLLNAQLQQVHSMPQR